MNIGIGINLSGTLDRVLERIRQAEADGFSSAWISGGRGLEAVMLCALAGMHSSRIELGTFVVPSYPRHPATMAQQALTAAAATGNRFTLGIGLSHRVVIEGQLGLDYSKPARHMREYLTVMGELFAGGSKFQGQEYRVNMEMAVPGAERPQVLVAALGPKMLRLAGTATFSR
jgi:5,10-methylenetetrahydromethanopterin reductase